MMGVVVLRVCNTVVDVICSDKIFVDNIKKKKKEYCSPAFFESNAPHQSMLAVDSTSTSPTTSTIHHVLL